jgi:hypothetical protein
VTTKHYKRMGRKPDGPSPRKYLTLEQWRAQRKAKGNAEIGPRGWRGESESHVADSRRGLKSDEPTRSIVHASNNPPSVVEVRRGIKDSRSGRPAWFASPHNTHGPDGAVKSPKRATRQPVSR